MPKGITIQKYKETMLYVMERVCPKLSRMEILDAIDYSINKRYKAGTARLHNNYTKTEVNMDFIKLANDLLNKKAIMSSLMHGILNS